MLAVAATVLTGCGQAQMSIEAYQRYVVETLNGSPLQDDGLGAVLNITIGDLGCEGDICTSRIRFQYLTQEPRGRLPIVADYLGRICKRNDVQPPPANRQDHNTLCDALDSVFRSLDKIVLTASNGLRLGGSDAEAQSPAFSQMRHEIDQRLTQEREALQQILVTLRGIAWLRSIL